MPRPIPFWLPILLGTLTAIGPLSIDMYLPGFPAIEAEFSALGLAPATLAAFFAGLAVGQMVQGALADRYGRRAPLLAGLGLYTAASVGCALAPDITTLSVFRALAAFGGSAGMVIPRAMVRDLAQGVDAARLMSRLMLVMGAAPILAPSLGALLLDRTGWRGMFWLLAAYGLSAMAAIVWKLPETLPPPQRRRAGLRAVTQTYVSLLHDRYFLAPALTSGLGLGGMFASIAATPAIFIGHFHMPPDMFAVVFGLNASGFIVASQINSLLLRRYHLGHVLSRALVALGLAALILLGMSLWNPPSGWWLQPPLMLCMATLGCVVPNATVEALARHGARAGSASALMGTLQFLLGACFGLAATLLADGTPMPLAGLILVSAAGALLADRWRRQGLQA